MPAKLVNNKPKQEQGIAGKMATNVAGLEPQRELK